MAYQESIKVANRHHRERRERMHPLRRAIVDAATAVAIIAFCLAFWAAALAPLIAFLFR